MVSGNSDFKMRFYGFWQVTFRAERFYKTDQWAPDGIRRTDARQDITIDQAVTSAHSQHRSPFQTAVETVDPE
jgi:hypothetical protein